MPKKPIFKDSNNYLVIWCEAGKTHFTEFVGAKCAVNGYRFIRKLHGDDVRLTKVVVNYGEEI